jgi:hypothetical protein
MSKEKIPIIPSLAGFEKILFDISVIAKEEVLRLHNVEKEKRSLSNDCLMQDSSSIGSTVMHLNKKSALFKFLSNINYNPEQFYFISIYDNKVSIVLRNMGEGQSYIPKKAAYDIIVKELIEKYNWDIYNDVRVD